MIGGILGTTSRRYLLRHPLQTGLTLLGIMLGVAIVVATDLANNSARRAFALSVNMISGTATHQISGGAQGIPEDIYRRLRVEKGLRSSAPRVMDEVQSGNHRLTLLGLDPFAHSFSRPLAPFDLSARQGRELFLQPNSVAMARRTARRLGVGEGDVLEVSFRGQVFALRVALVFDSDQPASAGLLVADISVAQELLGRTGVLDRIDLSIDDEATRDALQRWLPAGLHLSEAATGRGTLQQLTAAFHTNLSAMSLLALLVGGFLIYNSMAFAVLRRREQFGVLRALGVSRGELFGLVFGEAALLGILATAAGLCLGIGLAQILTRLVTTTINDLYYSLHVSQLLISKLALLKGAALGLGTTAVAAWLPAHQAAHAAPITLQQRSRVESFYRRLLPYLLVVGTLLMLAGLGLARWPSRSLLLGFAALALLVVGFSLTIGQLVQWLSRLCEALLGSRGSTLIRLGLRGISGGLSRIGLAVAALTLALATTLGVGIMIGSFRATVATWLEQSFASDVYVSTPGATSERPGPGLPPRLIAQLSADPRVSYSLDSRSLRVTTEYGPVRLVAMEYQPGHARGFNLKSGDLASARSAFAAGRGILVSGPYAYHHRLQVGDSVRFDTPSGAATLPVLAIFHDYTSDRGLVLMPLARYQALWQDRSISALALYRKPGISLDDFSSAVRQRAGRFSATLRVRTNAEIRDQSLQVFDRTFTVTQVLRLLCIAIAFIGVLSALLSLQLEKTREFALLRAIGVTPPQIRGLVLGQTLLIGLFAGLLALPLGIIMSALLIDVINVRSFGWTMQRQIPFAILWQTLLLALAAACLAGIYPAIKAEQLRIARSLREE